MKKLSLLLTVIVISISLSSQNCSRPYFSEYVEGSSFNKALEIYNPTSDTVDLQGYKVLLFANGGLAPTVTFNLNSLLLPGDVYVIANNQAIDSIKSRADTISGVTGFNGNDAVALLYGTDTLDVIGIIGNDPGAIGWTVDTGTTTNHTLIRRDTVQNGTRSWTLGATEWYALGQDTIRLGAHVGPVNLLPCGVLPIDTLVGFSPTSGTFTGINGNFDLKVVLSSLHFNTDSVDVQLSSGNAAWVNNYVTETLVFSPDSLQKFLYLAITNDTTGGLTHTLTFKLVNPVGGIVIGPDSVFTLTLQPPVVVIPDTCATIFFSEYVEGSSNNKALELYNPTAAPVNLSGYSVELYINGSATPTSVFNLNAVLAPGQVYVIASSQANDSIKAAADTLSSVTNFNGNDAVVLMYGGDTLDVIGVVGVDPGATGWTVGTGTTANHTLVRMSSVQKGNKNWAVAADQWDVLDQDTIRLGVHTGPVNVNACTLISGFSEEEITPALRLYPNPNTGNFMIEMDALAAEAEVKLFDLTGKEIYFSKISSNQTQIDATYLSAGMFLVEVKAGKAVSHARVNVLK